MAHHCLNRTHSIAHQRLSKGQAAVEKGAKRITDEGLERSKTGAWGGIPPNCFVLSDSQRLHPIMHTFLKFGAFCRGWSPGSYTNGKCATAAFGGWSEHCVLYSGAGRDARLSLYQMWHGTSKSSHHAVL